MKTDVDITFCRTTKNRELFVSEKSTSFFKSRKVNVFMKKNGISRLALLMLEGKIFNDFREQSNISKILVVDEHDAFRMYNNIFDAMHKHKRVKQTYCYVLI